MTAATIAASDNRTFPSPADFPESPLSQALRQLALRGLFLPIRAGGRSMSALPLVKREGLWP